MYDYQLYQTRQSDQLRRAEQQRLARDAQTGHRAFYRPALAQLGRSLEKLGERLQEQHNLRSMPGKAYR